MSTSAGHRRLQCAPWWWGPTFLAVGDETVQTSPSGVGPDATRMFRRGATDKAESRRWYLSVLQNISLDSPDNPSGPATVSLACRRRYETERPPPYVAVELRCGVRCAPRYRADLRRWPCDRIRGPRPRSFRRPV